MATPYDTIKAAIIGTPPQLNKKPSRQGVVRAFAEMQTQLEAAQAGAFSFGTKAGMQSVTAAPVWAMAWVTNDATVANNGIYTNAGTALATNWIRRTSIPQFLLTALQTGGTANAIEAETDLPLPTEDGRALIIVPIITTNTLAGPTVSLNDGTPLTILSNSGNPVVPGALTAGSNMAGFVSDDGTTFRLISDQATQALVTAAEAAATTAEAAAVQAQNVVSSQLATVAEAEASSFLIGPSFIRLAGYAASGDGGAALYKKVLAEPSHAGGKFMITLDDTVTDVWYELAETKWITPEMFGAVGNGVANDTTAMQNCWNFGVPVLLRSGATYLVTGLRPRNGLKVVGDRTPTIKLANATNDNIIGPSYVGTVLDTIVYENVTLDGFTLDGNKANQTIAAGYSLFQRCIMGIYRKFKIARINFIGSVRGDVRLMDGSQDGVIEECRFIESGKWLGGLSDGSAMQGISISGSTSKNITIRRNFFKGIGTAVHAAFPGYTGGVNNLGIIVENQSYFINIVDNWFEDISNEHIQFTRDPSSDPNQPATTQRPGKSIIAFNIFEGMNVGMYAINPGINSDNILIQGNIIRNMKMWGIRVTPWMRDVSIVDNKIEYCEAGIALSIGTPSGAEWFGQIEVSQNTIQYCNSSGIMATGNFADTPIKGLAIQNNRIRNNGLTVAGSAGIRLACNADGAIISGNICTDDQAVKTQEYGLITTNPVGGSGTWARVVVSNNNFMGNLTAAALISADRSGFTFIGNVEGANPALYHTKENYDLAANGATAALLLGTVSIGRKVSHIIEPKADAGPADAFGAPVVTYGCNSAGQLSVQVRNLSATNKAVGSVYIYLI